jgi:Protein of unknown function (DUF1499)
MAGAGLPAARRPGGRTRRWRRQALGLALAVLAGLLLGGVLMAMRYPLINDISTDRAHPPRYLAAPPRDPAYDAAALRGPTERAYPGLDNWDSPRAPAEVFAAVEALVAARGWRVAARESGGPGAPWRLQAVAVTPLLRFKDDVLIEVRPRADGGSTVALRSKSRLGRGDFGANAARIRAFLADLQARLGG